MAHVNQRRNSVHQSNLCRGLQPRAQSQTAQISSYYSDHFVIKRCQIKSSGESFMGVKCTWTMKEKTFWSLGPCLMVLVPLCFQSVLASSLCFILSISCVELRFFTSLSLVKSVCLSYFDSTSCLVSPVSLRCVWGVSHLHSYLGCCCFFFFCWVSLMAVALSAPSFIFFSFPAPALQSCSVCLPASTGIKVAFFLVHFCLQSPASCLQTLPATQPYITLAVCLSFFFMLNFEACCDLSESIFRITKT